MSNLLPSNSTALERALADLSVRVDGIDPTSISHLWNAETCPEAILPWLAWSLSVDAWDDTWTTVRKREAIALSPAYHRIKGTVASIEMITRLFGCRTTLIDWWQKYPQGRRGTSTIRAYVAERTVPGAPLITPELIAKVRAAIFITKPKSRAVAIEMGVVTQSYAGAAVAARAGLIETIQGSAAPPTQTAAQAGASTVSRAAMFRLLTATTSPSRPGMEAGMTAALAGTQIIRLSGEARPQ